MIEVEYEAITEADNPTETLDGKWAVYDDIARRFEHKAKHQDIADLRHRIIIRLCEVADRREAEGRELTHAGMLRVASYVTLSYWRDEKRNGRFINLNTPYEDVEGEVIELIDTLSDDCTFSTQTPFPTCNLDAWADASIWLLGCPKRLIEIGLKLTNEVKLSPAEHKYIHRFRKHQQAKLNLVTT